MADVVVYTYSDPTVMAGVLQGVSMLFDPGNSDLFASNSGFGLGVAAGAGLLIAFLFILGKSVIDQRIEFHKLLIVLVCFFAMVSVKKSVVVENLMTGELSAQVDDVPIVLAWPMGMTSSLSMNVAEELETNISPPNAAPLSDGGALNPLRLVLSLRNGEIKNENLRASILQFTQYCLRSATQSIETNSISREGAMETLFSGATFPVNAVTLYYNSANPYNGTYNSGLTISCVQASTRIRNDILAYLNAVGRDGMAASVESGYVRDQLGPSTPLKDEIAQGLQTITGKALINSDETIANMLVSNLVKKGVAASALPTSQAQEAMVMTESMEQWRMDMAGEASMFVRLMLPAMSILSFVFIAVFPIVCIVIMAMGVNGLGMFGKYILFGAWTQSWLPVAAIINAYVTITIQQKMIKLSGASGFATFDPEQSVLKPTMLAQFYKVIADDLGVANTLLASTPVLTFAILSGSYFAMTAMAQRMSGAGGYFDEKKLAPDVGAASRGDQVLSSARSLATNTGHGIASGAYAGAVAGPSLQSVNNAGQVDSGSVLSMGQSATSQLGRQKQAARNAVMGSMAEFGRSFSQQASSGDSYAQDAMKSMEQSKTYQSLLSFAQSHMKDMKESEQKKWAANAAANIGAFGASAGLNAARESSEVASRGLQDKFDQTVQANEQAIAKDAQNWSHKVDKAIKQNAELGGKAQEVARLERSYTETSTALNTAQDTVSQMQNLTAKYGAVNMANLAAHMSAAAGGDNEGRQLMGRLMGSGSAASTAAQAGGAGGTAALNRIQSQFDRNPGRQGMENALNEATSILNQPGSSAAAKSVAAGFLAQSLTETDRLGQQGGGAGYAQYGAYGQAVGQVNAMNQALAKGELAADGRPAIAAAARLEGSARGQIAQQGSAADDARLAQADGFGQGRAVNENANPSVPVTKEAVGAQIAERWMGQPVIAAALDRASLASAKQLGYAGTGQMPNTFDGRARPEFAAVAQKVAADAAQLQAGRNTDALLDKYAPQVQTMLHPMAEADKQAFYGMTKAQQGVVVGEMLERSANSLTNLSRGNSDPIRPQNLTPPIFAAQPPAAGGTKNANLDAVSAIGVSSIGTGGRKLPGSQGELNKVGAGYNAAVSTASRQSGLSENTIRALMYIESSGNHHGKDGVLVSASFRDKPISSKTPLGLMQVSGDAARDAGFSQQDLLDPAKNIQAGSAYYSQLKAKYGGDDAKAIAAYNWGQGNLDRHLARARDNRTDWIQTLPTETRNYIRNYNQIMRNAGN